MYFYRYNGGVLAKSLQSFLFANPRDCSPPGSSVHDISQVRILEWLPLSSPGNLPNPGFELAPPALAGGFFIAEPTGRPNGIFSSVHFCHSVMSDSLQPHGLQHSRLPCSLLSPSLLKPISIKFVMPSNHLVICHFFSSCLQSLLASGSFPVSQLFASSGQSIGVSTLAQSFQWIFRVGFL